MKAKEPYIVYDDGTIRVVCELLNHYQPTGDNLLGKHYIIEKNIGCDSLGVNMWRDVKHKIYLCDILNESDERLNLKKLLDAVCKDVKSKRTELSER